MTIPQPALRDLIPVIGDEWYELLAPITLTPHRPEVLHQQLHSMAEQLINLLLGQTFSGEVAEALGASLAEYQCVQPDVLGRTQELFSRRLFTQVALDQATRLSAILGCLSTGYIKRSRDIILQEQEEIRGAHIEAYKALQQTVNLSEKRYRTLVESANQAIFTLDRQGTLRFLNGSGARELGGHPRDFVGKTITMLIPRPQSELLLTGLTGIIESGESTLVEAEVPIRGHNEWFQASLKPLRNKAGEYETLLGIAANITERKMTEAALQRSKERLATLHELDKGILAAQSPEEIAHAALLHAKELIPCWAVFVMLLDDTGGRATFLFTDDANGYLVEKPGASGKWSLAPELREDEVIILDKIPEYLEPLLSSQGFDNLAEQPSLLAPLVMGEQLIGILILIADPAVHFEANDVEVAQEIAAPLAIAIHNARLLEAHRAAKEENEQLAHQIQEYADGLEQLVDERTQELTALYDVTAVTSEFLERQTIMEKTLERALSALARNAGTIQLIDAESQQLGLVAFAGLSRDLAVQLNSLVDQAGLIDRVFESRKPLVIAVEEDNPVLQPGIPPGQYGCIVCTPMRNQGQILGILTVFDNSENQFSVDDVALLASIADHMGVAVENVRLREQAEQIAVGEEQKRLARELHDSVTQALYSLTLFAEAAQENGRSGRLELVQTQLADIGAASQQALKEMRLLLYELRDGAPEREGLLVALRHRLESVELRSGMSTRLNADPLVNVPIHVEQGLLRVAVGALNNTIRHAGATAVHVSIRQNGNILLMEISDNGKGFDLAAVEKRGGMGLQIMRERVEEIKGHLEIQTSPESGTCIRAEVDTALINNGSMENRTSRRR